MAFRFLRQSLVTASVITIGANILSRLFGYVREAAVANYFGTSQIFDIFILAFTIPELIASVILMAMPAALIPALKKIQGRTDDGSGEAFWSGMLSLSLLFAAISILIFLCRGSIFSWLAPQMTGEQFLKGKRLLAILSVFVFFRGAEAYFRGWLYEKKHFIVPAVSALVMNIVILVVFFVLYSRVDIEALAFGWLAASVILFIYNFAFALYVIRPGLQVDLKMPWLKVLLSSLLVVAILESITMVFPMIDRYLAARWLGSGQIAALRYADILIQIPVGVFVVAYNIAALPWLSDYSVPGKDGDLRRIYRESTGLILFCLGFIALTSIVFSADIVRLAFMRGAFDLSSLDLTASPFRIYATGIIFHSLHIFQMRLYYAKSLLGRLGIILLIKLLVKLALSALLVQPLEQNGLALSTSISWLCVFLIMSYDLRKATGVTGNSLFSASGVKVLLSLMLLWIYWSLGGTIWPASQIQSFAAAVLRFALFTVTGLAVYVGAAHLMNLPEPGKMILLLRRAFQKNRSGEL